jgi:hypothetical protein
MVRKYLYVLAVCCLVGIVIAYATALANRSEAGLGAAIMCIWAITLLFVILDVVVLFLLGKAFHDRFLRKQMTALAAILVFLLASGAVVVFLFAVCGLAVYSSS